ncbi:hypothetical protein HYV79_01550 [Candidatus Woesearchaeota archaeon]|nr:hypothetical protein [Candidatus Woesearchaeota archaeon]
MNNEKGFGLVLLALVAIVALVGLVLVEASSVSGQFSLGGRGRRYYEDSALFENFIPQTKNPLNKIR